MTGLLGLLKDYQPQEQQPQPKPWGAALMGIGHGLTALSQGQTANLAPYAQMGQQQKKSDPVAELLSDPTRRKALQSMPPQMAERILMQTMFGVDMPQQEQAKGVNVGGRLVNPVTGEVIYEPPQQAPEPNMKWIDGVGMVDMNNPPPELGHGQYQPPAEDPDMQFVPGVGFVDKNNVPPDLMAGQYQDPQSIPAGAQTLEWRARQAGLEPGTPEWEEFMRSGGKVSESRMIMGPDGTPIMVEGDAATNFRFTETQAKDNVYSTRARGALEMLEPVAGALTSRWDRAAEYGPFGVGREFQSDDFQVAQQAGTEFLQAILRKDTGAAITKDETESYGRTYLPQPGDGAKVLEAKRQARIRAINALESGMTAQQMLARDRALIRAAEESGTGDGATGPANTPLPETPDFDSMTADEIEKWLAENG